MASAEYGVSGIHANFHIQQNKLRVNQNFHLLSMDVRKKLPFFLPWLLFMY